MQHPLTGLNIDPHDGRDDQRSGDATAIGFSASTLLMAVGNGLFLVFLAYAIVESLPLQLLNPRWQLAFAGRMLSLGLIPVLGLLCVHLAVIFNPIDKLLQRRLASIRKAATFAAIGFLLLIALQGFATWRSYTQLKTEQQSLTKAYKRRIAPVRAAISSATSSTDLQQRLISIQDLRLRLAPEDLALPLDVLKKGVDDTITREENLYLDRISGPKPEQIWAAMQSGVKTILASIGYFLAFAAGAQPGRTPLTLLEMFSHRFDFKPGNRRRRSTRA